ncbi:MAG: UDP-2,3-diacylglucosamine diphosphatase LpxI [Nitrospirae bacterium]|nr:UDP-2,3-diacylglucosamine diphosphatase LpxI [Nitrospirota bacterium]MBI3351891.1 UDP-2,3-diacylglucosamine diphosphatase LpxI [Nitrospirota bacterium]
MEKIGLIAGNGRFPIIFASQIKSQGKQVIAVAHLGETERDLEAFVDKIFWIKVGQLGKLIKIFKHEHVQNIVMAGGIKKTRLFTDVLPDLRAVRLLSSLKEKKDDAILRAIASDLEKEGLHIKDSSYYLFSLLVEEGPLTSRKPTKKEFEDIEFGWKIGKGIGKLDIGQSIVVKDKVVLAVEAIEGTDEAIKRGGRLGEENAIVVKICKPGQDLRFDLPAIGPGTIKSMVSVKASILAVEAGNTLLLDREETLKAAEKGGIGIIGVRYE